jgi:hypothetical protein
MVVNNKVLLQFAYQAFCGACKLLKTPLSADLIAKGWFSSTLHWTAIKTDNDTWTVPAVALSHLVHNCCQQTLAISKLSCRSITIIAEANENQEFGDTLEVGYNNYRTTLYSPNTSRSFLGWTTQQQWRLPHLLEENIKILPIWITSLSKDEANYGFISRLLPYHRESHELRIIDKYLCW